MKLKTFKHQFIIFSDFYSYVGRFRIICNVNVVKMYQGLYRYTNRIYTLRVSQFIW